MPTFGDSVSITTTSTAEVTGTINVPGGARLYEISVQGVDNDSVPTQVRIDFQGITTPQKYGTGVVALFATSGSGIGIVKIPIDLQIPPTINAITVGLTATGAGTWLVNVKWMT
jgi:hypothetical protein